MSDLATMTQRIKEELPRNSSVEDDRVYRAIIDSINYYKDHAFGFNEDTATFTTVASQQTYTRGAGANNFPADLFWIKTAFVDVSGAWNPIEQKSLSDIRYETSTDVNEGYPALWAFHNDTIYFSPIPHVAGSIRLDYVKDIGVPVATYDSTWTFVDEDGATLTGAYTNSWFTDAEELIRLHAEGQLTQVVFKNQEHAYSLAQRERAVYNNLKHRHIMTKVGMTRTSDF